MIYGENLDNSMFFGYKIMVNIILCSVVLLTSDFSIIIFPHTYPMQELEILRTYYFTHNCRTQELEILMSWVLLLHGKLTWIHKK